MHKRNTRTTAIATKYQYSLNNSVIPVVGTVGVPGVVVSVVVPIEVVSVEVTVVVVAVVVVVVPVV
jgi:hypothetical protein